MIRSCSYLTCIDATIRVAGAEKVLINRLEVAAITVLIAPDGQLRLPLTRGFLAAIVGGAPANDSGTASRQTILWWHSSCPWQTNGYNIL